MNQTELKIKTAQIGQCGVLLLQFELLRNCIVSAPMTTDSGVDLVAYSPKSGKAITIQVKTNKEAKRGGGKGRNALDWWISTKNTAQYIAFVDLKSKSIWMFKKDEIPHVAQQKSGGKHHFYMYIDDDVKTRTGNAAHCYEFKKFLLENKIHEVFEI